MGTPIYVNPSPSPFPFIDLNEDQSLEDSGPVPNEAASSFSCPIFFSLSQDQRGSDPRESPQNQLLIKVDSYDTPVIPFSSVDQRAPDDSSGCEMSVCKGEDGDERKSEDDSMKWMCSKMRVMRKMISSNCSGTDHKPARIVQKKFNYSQGQDSNRRQVSSVYNSNDTVRVCSDCNTTKTPLWRGGPQGPKSLCNACGIRQRKARRAMAAAAAATSGAGMGTETCTSSKVHNKEKKPRTSYIKKHKKHNKSQDFSRSRKKLSFEDFALNLSGNSAFRQVFPQDEEEAAILLMALSCGLLHSS